MDQSWWTWLVLGGLMLVMLFLPQWQARRREQKKRAELQEGARVVTIGGFIGTLTYYNPDENRARIKEAGRAARGCPCGHHRWFYRHIDLLQSR